jgi:transcriptional regulator with XRE-family HTH domain
MPRHKIDWYGPRLRELRERAGLSQAELGKRVNLAGSQINKLETNVNQPTLATALAIAAALGVPIQEFAGPGSPRPRGRSPGAEPAAKKPRARKPQ